MSRSLLGSGRDVGGALGESEPAACAAPASVEPPHCNSIHYLGCFRRLVILRS